MATLNMKRTATPIKTHEGGQASRINAEDQLSRSVMSCLLWEKEFYESGCSIVDRIRELIPKVKAETVAAMAVQARSEMSMRHIPLLMVREMARHDTHKHLVAETLVKVIQRADELSEFLAIYWSEGKKPISKQVKKGLAEAFRKFNEYSLAKYNREKEISLRDVLFMVHAKPEGADQADLWKKLVDDTLAVPDTWETELSASKDKTASWNRLLTENKLGALALLRNLRNMAESQIPIELMRAALNKADASKVFPFRFIAAARFAPRLEPELESALFRNVQSLPKLSGKTVVLVDVSGSMDDPMSSKSDMRRVDAACGLAMVAREICEEVRVMTFSNTLCEVAPRRGFALRDAIVGSQPHGGTNLGGALAAINGYDRLIVITDEQTSGAVPDPSGKGYMINVASARNGVGYGPWLHLDGFSEAVIRYIMEYERQESTR